MMLLNRFTQLGLTGTPARRYGWDALATPDCLTASAVPATPTLSRSTSVSVNALGLGSTPNTLNLSRSSTFLPGTLELVANSFLPSVSAGGVVVTPATLSVNLSPQSLQLSSSPIIQVNAVELSAALEGVTPSTSLVVSAGDLSLAITQEAASFVRDAIITLESQNLTSALLPVTILTGEGETAVVWLYLYNLRSR